MDRRKLTIGILAAAGGVALGAPEAEAGKAGNGATGTAKRKAGKTGKDPNVKNDQDVNRKGAKVAAPPKKGGTQTARGTYGTIHVDNRTGLWVQIFIDGQRRDTVGPYGDVYRDVVAGRTELYGRAVYDDGSYDTFGPTEVYVRADSTFTWTLVE